RLTGAAQSAAPVRWFCESYRRAQLITTPFGASGLAVDRGRTAAGVGPRQPPQLFRRLRRGVVSGSGGHARRRREGMNGISCGRRGLGGALALVLSISLLGSGCSRTASTSPEAARPVKTMVVTAGGEPHVRSFPGKAEASKRVELAFQVPGLLVSLPV